MMLFHVYKNNPWLVLAPNGRRWFPAGRRR